VIGFLFCLGVGLLDCWLVSMDAWRARLQASFDFLMEDDDEEDAFNMSLVLGLGFGMEGDLGLSRGSRARSLLQNSPTLPQERSYAPPQSLAHALPLQATLKKVLSD
jgi:hypothetical protein